MKAIVCTMGLTMMVGCATERGNIRHAEHARAQIEMVAVQREAAVQELSLIHI